MLEAVKKHEQYLGVCENELGEDFKSCEAVMADMEQLATDGQSAVAEGLALYSQGLAIYAEFTKCATKSIFKQVTCYENVIASAKSLIATAQEEAAAIQEALSTDVAQLKTDLKSCTASGYTSQLFNTKMAICKLRLMMKN